MKLKRNQPEDEGNPVTGWHVGEEKQQTYDGFSFVDSRRISRETIAAAEDCLARAWWNRWHRDLAARGVALGKVPINAARAEMSLPPFLLPNAEPPPTATRYSVFSDVRLEGEAAARALGLDNEWRTILNMPPLRCGPCTRWDCRDCAGEVPVGMYRVPCGCMDCEEGSE